MEFDKSRVYTAVNADELKVGSKCIFANNVFTLKDHVRNNYPAEILINVCSETITERFNSDSDEFYSLAYLIEPTAEPKYKPFSNIDKAREAINKHGGWISRRDCENYFFITGYLPNLDNGAKICIGPIWHSLQELCDDFLFTDDRTPCGELVEE